MPEVSSRSHIPILVMVALLFKPKRVLELGTGLISTPIFIDRQIFSEIEEFTTIENGPEEWFKTCKQAFGELQLPYTLKYVPGQLMSEIVLGMDLTGYDLILIDDSTELHHRAATIKAVFSKVAQNTIVLIHDFERKEYRECITWDVNGIIFDGVLPHTGLFCTNELNLTILKRVQVQLSVLWNASHTTAAKWKEIFCNVDSPLRL